MENDRESVVALIMRYARSLDDRDFDHLDEIFADDCSAEAWGSIRAEGLAARRAMIEERLAGIVNGRASSKWQWGSRLRAALTSSIR